MLSWMGKEKITIEDLNELFASGQVETDQLEFKRALPSKGGPSPWENGGADIGEKAKIKLLSELVALANTHGGWLLLGIDESEEQPPKATGITPIARCTELATKLHQIADDLIEPRLPNLSVEAVTTTEDGRGVVVLSTGRSPAAPHRLLKDNNVYIRRHDRCSAASMAEIQRLVIETRRREIEALWTLAFGSGAGRNNGGVVALDQGRLFGGDGQFYYEGHYEVLGENEVVADFRVHHYFGDRMTAWGDRATGFSVTARAERSGDKIVGTISRLGFSSAPVTLTRRRNLP